jgi:AraC-like DNA-binding protein
MQRTERGGWVLPTALKAAPRLLREAGVDPVAVARRIGFDLRRLNDPESTISFPSAGRFLAECARATHCPHFGLMVGTEEGFAALCVVGHLVRHSRDVRATLRNLTGHLHHQEVGGVSTLVVEHGVGVLEYALHQRGLEGTDQIIDTGLGIGVSILKIMCGPDWKPIEIQLTRAVPQETAPYRRLFGSPVRFGADRNALLFHERWLEHRLRGADPNLRKILEATIAEMEARRSAEFPDRVRALIRTQLLSDGCTSEETARRMAMTRRTLHRRLVGDAFTFEQLLDETRFDLARQLLRNSRASMVDIAAALDYANASAFTRAFRRWAGVAPSAWRLDMQGAAGRAGSSRPGA